MKNYNYNSKLQKKYNQMEAKKVADLIQCTLDKQ